MWRVNWSAGNGACHSHCRSKWAKWETKSIGLQTECCCFMWFNLEIYGGLISREPTKNWNPFRRWYMPWHVCVCVSRGGWVDAMFIMPRNVEWYILTFAGFCECFWWKMQWVRFIQVLVLYITMLFLSMRCQILSNVCEVLIALLSLFTPTWRIDMYEHVPRSKLIYVLLYIHILYIYTYV